MASKIVRFTVFLSIVDGKLEAFEKIAETMLAATRSISRELLWR